ncbi:hypothetical protein Bbelb_019830 [Branchiostoma belcheri]|nr:hypothetical protein Bbelb_019830 [Branchiostoma belcheri]
MTCTYMINNDPLCGVVRQRARLGTMRSQDELHRLWRDHVGIRPRYAGRGAPASSLHPTYSQPAPSLLPTCSQPTPNLLPTYTQPKPNLLPTYSQPTPNLLQTCSQPNPSLNPTYSQPTPNLLQTCSQPTPSLHPTYSQPTPNLLPTMTGEGYTPHRLHATQVTRHTGYTPHRLPATQVTRHTGYPPHRLHATQSFGHGVGRQCLSFERKDTQPAMAMDGRDRAQKQFAGLICSAVMTLETTGFRLGTSTHE